MSDGGKDVSTREFELKSRELDLRAEELKVRQGELAAKSWFASPLTLAAIGTASGLFATALSLHLQGINNNKLEQKKMEYALIQAALADGNKKQAVRNLNFLQDINLINQLTSSRIKEIMQNSERAPSFAGAVIRDNIISVKDAKDLLIEAKVYDGESNNTDDSKFRKAVAMFQMGQGMLPDGLLGPCTLRALWAVSKRVPFKTSGDSDPKQNSQNSLCKQLSER